MGVLNASQRKQIPAKQFGIPSERKYPMPDRAHAANAKARATQQVAAGNLSPERAAHIRNVANAILRKPHG